MDVDEEESDESESEDVLEIMYVVLVMIEIVEVDKSVIVELEGVGLDILCVVEGGG